MKKNKRNRNFILRWINNFGTESEKDYIVENLSTLISSNVEVIEAFDSIKKEIKSKYLSKQIDLIISDIHNGVPLWRSLKESGLFKDSVISLVRIGEETGRLPENLLLVAERNRKNRSFKSKLNTAMMYPVFVLSLTVVVGTGIAWFILPKLSVVFGQLKLELPWLTKVIIRLGEILGEHGTVVVPIFLASLFFVFLILFVFPKTKFLGQIFLFHVPGIGKLVKEIEVARFGYLFGTLLQAGIPIDESLKSLKTSTPTFRYRKFYSYLEQTVTRGHSIGYAFSKYKKSGKLIVAPIQQMIVTGERSGNLDEMLLKIGKIYEEKTEETIKSVSVLLEPILLVVVWLGVMAIALGVILPIYGLLGGIS